MRVISGRLGGRNITSPRGNRTRPMSEKLRGALFNTLGDIEGLSFLDAFAGSGALSFEAISRGASSATSIDNDKSAQLAIAANIKSLGVRGVIKPINAGAGSWLSTSNDQFDIVICDPPYDDLQQNLILKLAARVVIGGLIVLSLPPSSDFKLPEAYQLLTSKNYGDATLTFYRRLI